MTQCVEEQIRPLPAIEPKSHFFEVGCEMLCADFVPRADDSALQKREGVFHGIRVNVAHDVDLAAMVDGFVFRFRNAEGSHRFRIAAPIVRKDHVYIFADVLSDILCDGSRCVVARMEEAKFSIALADTDYDFFVVLVRFVPLTDILSSDIGFIYFDLAVEHWLFNLTHCGPDAMAEIPSRFVAADPERPLNLAGRNSFLRLTQKQGCGEPHDERQVCIIENGASENRKLVVAVLAIEQLLFCFKFDGIGFASRATQTFGPAQPREKFPAFVIAREHSLNIN